MAGAETTQNSVSRKHRWFIMVITICFHVNYVKDGRALILQNNIHTYTHAHTHTYIHTYMHTYIRTHYSGLHDKYGHHYESTIYIHKYTFFRFQH